MVFVILWEEGDPYPQEVGRCQVDFPYGRLKGKSQFEAELAICHRMRIENPDIDKKYPNASPRVLFPKGFFRRS